MNSYTVDSQTLNAVKGFEKMPRLLSSASQTSSTDCRKAGYHNALSAPYIIAAITAINVIPGYTTTSCKEQSQ